MTLRNSNSAEGGSLGYFAEGQGQGQEQTAFIGGKKTEQPRQRWKRTAVFVVDQMEKFVQNLPKKVRLSLHHFKHAHLLLYSTLCLLLFVSYLQSRPAMNMTSSDQSYGLIQVPDQEWYRLKAAYASTEQHVYDKYLFIDDPNVWYQYNYPVEFTCPNPQRIGKSQDTDYDGYLGDGKWICNPQNIVDVVHKRMRRSVWQGVRELLGHRYRGKNGCLIYSIGVNAKHVGFETGIQNVLTREANKRKKKNRKKDEPFCEIHVFDPAGYNEQLVLGDGIIYHNWGIISSSRTSIVENALRGTSDGGFKSFQQTVRELGHEGYVIDIMKVDCKMCEWGIYDDWFEHENEGGDDNEEMEGEKKVDTRLSMVQQILVETHGTPEEYVNEFFERMQDENYAIFHKDSDTQNFQGTSQDYAFVKLADEFFELR